MTKLRTLKNSAKLLRLTRYNRAENQNATRWTSVNYSAVKILEPFIPPSAFEVETLQYIPNLQYIGGLIPAYAGCGAIMVQIE